MPLSMLFLLFLFVSVSFTLCLLSDLVQRPGADPLVDREPAGVGSDGQVEGAVPAAVQQGRSHRRMPWEVSCQKSRRFLPCNTVSLN